MHNEETTRDTEYTRKDNEYTTRDNKFTTRNNEYITKHNEYTTRDNLVLNKRQEIPCIIMALKAIFQDVFLMSLS